MAKRLLENLAAEKEADRIGAQFANSNDVVGDMERKYSFDFSGVNLHGGEEGASMAESHGDLAYAQGKDAYFGGDLLNKHTPEANMAVGHELTHVMQQNDGAGVSEHVPFGESQGLGFFRKVGNWFKNLFSRKKKSKAAETEQKSAEGGRESNAASAGKSPNLNAAVRYKSFEEQSIYWFGGTAPDRMSRPFQQQDYVMKHLAAECDDLENVNVEGVKGSLDRFIDNINNASVYSNRVYLRVPLNSIISQFNAAVDNILPDFDEYSSYVQSMGGDVSQARANYEALRVIIEQFKAKLREALREKFKDDDNVGEAEEEK